MFKKLFCGILAISLVFSFAGCKKNTDTLSVDRGEDIAISVPEEPKYAVNNLTGLEDLSPEKANRRPMAITINNISIAQPVQTGIGKADIVYETEVEGGITRLVAIFKDTTGIEKIGTIRSARYAFIDLAMGHDAIYVHHGQDSYHAGRHLKDVDRLVVSKNDGGARISNGLSSEHTLYGYGDGMWQSIVSKGFETTTEKNENWQNFVTETVKFSNVANKVTVPFSASYKTEMNYDAASGKYIRYFNGTERRDYYTKENLAFKNVFVLNTTIRSYPGCTDGKGHKEVLLNSGDGYYIVNGTYTPIKWSKGNASNSFKFTNVDGTALEVAAGNSWVCIADMNRSKPIFA